MKTRGKIKDKRQAILDASLSLITEYGFHGTSMKMIADKAGIAAGTIYVHFRNKEEMINMLYKQISKELDDLLNNEYDAKLSFKENFIKTWLALLDYYISDLRVSDFATQYAYSPYIDNMAKTDSDQMLSFIIKLFKQAQENNEVKAMPISALIALVHGPITSILRMTKYQEINVDDIDRELFANACWAAIKTEQ